MEFVCSQNYIIANITENSFSHLLHVFIFILNSVEKIVLRVAYDKFTDFFSHGHFYELYTHETLVPFEVISSGCNALVVPIQQLLEGPMEDLLCDPWEKHVLISSPTKPLVSSRAGWAP